MRPEEQSEKAESSWENLRNEIQLKGLLLQMLFLNKQLLEVLMNAPCSYTDSGDNNGGD